MFVTDIKKSKREQKKLKLLLNCVVEADFSRERKLCLSKQKNPKEVFIFIFQMKLFSCASRIEFCIKIKKGISYAVVVINEYTIMQKSETKIHSKTIAKQRIRISFCC